MLTKENLWQRIKEHEGEIFHTTGRYLPFTYEVFGSYIITSRTKEHITLKNFQRIMEIGSEKPSEINKKIRGSYYIIAILSDPRITF